MKITIILLVAVVWTGLTFAVTRNIKTEADRKLQNQEQIAGATYRQLRYQRELAEDYKRDLETARQDREFRKLTGRPEPVDVRIVK